MPHVTTLPAKLHHIHVMGVAGTAMGSLAGMLHDAGYRVTGSDKAVYPPMSDYLAGLGIAVKEGFVAANLEPKPDLVVVGNVIRAAYEEAQALLASDIPYCSFPEVLGHLFLDEAHSVVIAGTHGKTTTTAVTAWLCESAGLAPGFLIGGIAKNFDRTARAGGRKVFVIEGDEYDTAFFDKGPKFLHYRPKTCVLTSVEFDHADIYTDLDHVKQAFRKLMAILPEDGVLIVRGDDPGAADVARDARCRVETYGPGQTWDGSIVRVDTERGVMVFSVTRDGAPIGTFESALVGTHNLYTQVAAAAAALSAGAGADRLSAGFSTFAGIKRRQEVLGEPGGVTVIDDFAHHPTAVQVTLQALRQRYGGRRLWAVWEPRSATSRRKTFQEQYASAFDEADLVVVAEPYDTSGIPPEARLDAGQLVIDMQVRGVDALCLPDAETIARTIAARAHPMDVVAVLSNGGFGGLHQRLLTLLEQRFV